MSARTDVSGIGLKIKLFATVAFPWGQDLTSFPADTDPMNLDDLNIANYEFGLNGDLIVWRTAQGFLMRFSLIPGCEEDKQMQLAADIDRVAKNKVSEMNTYVAVVYNEVTGEIVNTYTNGTLVSFTPYGAVTQGGKIRTTQYSIIFANRN